MRGRLFVFAMDGGDPDLLNRWMDSGDLPALAALRAAATSAICESPPELGNGEMWLTMLTGVNMGRHGINYIKQLRPGSYIVDLIDEDRDCKVPPIWQRMSAAGQRCIILDMFRAPLVPEVNGLQVNDWYAHFRVRPPRSTPPEEIDRLTNRFGPDPFEGDADSWFFRHRDYQRLQTMMLERVDLKTRAIVEYMNAQNWDVLMTAYGEPHDIAHLCWHLHDPQSALHDRALAEKLGDPIKPVYKRIDASFGQLVSRLSPDDTVVFFAGLGFQNLYSVGDLFDRILRQLDATVTRGPGRAPDAVRAVRRSVLKKVLPTRVRRLAGRILFRASETMAADDRRNRCFFAVPSEGHAGAVRINLVGREPQGKVAQQDFDAVTAELAQDFGEIVNIETGRPLVDRMVHTRHHYKGPFVDRLPDLFFVWDRRAPIRAVRSPKIGEMRTDRSTVRTGDHAPCSMLMVKGPGITARRLQRRVAPEDVGATLVALSGCDTSDLDGRPIAEIAAAAGLIMPTAKQES